MNSFHAAGWFGRKGILVYVVKGKHWIVRDGEKLPPVPSQVFHTAMEMLHWAVKNRAMNRTKNMTETFVPYAGSSDWSISFPWYFTPDQVDAMRRAYSRYRGILRYCREIEPEWREVSRTHYMDNSTEVLQRDKYGRTRKVTLIPSHGDVCY